MGLGGNLYTRTQNVCASIYLCRWCGIRRRKKQFLYMGERWEKGWEVELFVEPRGITCGIVCFAKSNLHLHSSNFSSNLRLFNGNKMRVLMIKFVYVNAIYALCYKLERKSLEK